MSKEDYLKKNFCWKQKNTQKKVWPAIRSIANVKQGSRYQPSNLIIEYQYN